jgi:adenylate cyclase
MHTFSTARGKSLSRADRRTAQSSIQVQCTSQGFSAETRLGEIQRAVEKDPKYALGYAGLADSYTLLQDYNYMSTQEALAKGKPAASRAVALDDNLSEAHLALAGIYDAFEWKWPEGEKEYQRAIALNPNCATAHHGEI